MQTLPKNIRIPVELDEKISEAAKKTGLLKADVMRIAMELGVKDLLLVRKTAIERLIDEVTEAKSKLTEPATTPRARNERHAM